MQDKKKGRDLKVQNFLKAKPGQISESIPQILLKGKWLAQAGFLPGDQIEVQVQHGQMLIKQKEVSND
ncbi:MAG: SymE family type I addiction module toxin [Flammeovirgaceae bacterium]